MTPLPPPPKRYRRPGQSRGLAAASALDADPLLFVCDHTTPRYRVWLWNGTNWDAWAMSARPRSRAGKCIYLGCFGARPDAHPGCRRIGLKQAPWHVQDAIRRLREA